MSEQARWESEQKFFRRGIHRCTDPPIDHSAVHRVPQAMAGGGVSLLYPGRCQGKVHPRVGVWRRRQCRCAGAARRRGGGRGCFAAGHRNRAASRGLARRCRSGHLYSQATGAVRAAGGPEVRHGGRLGGAPPCHSRAGCHHVRPAADCQAGCLLPFFRADRPLELAAQAAAHAADSGARHSR